MRFDLLCVNVGWGVGHRVRLTLWSLKEAGAPRVAGPLSTCGHSSRSCPVASLEAGARGAGKHPLQLCLSEVCLSCGCSGSCSRSWRLSSMVKGLLLSWAGSQARCLEECLESAPGPGPGDAQGVLGTSILGLRACPEKGQFFLKILWYSLSPPVTREALSNWAHFPRGRPFPSRQETCDSS